MKTTRQENIDWSFLGLRLTTAGIVAVLDTGQGATNWNRDSILQSIQNRHKHSLVMPTALLDANNAFTAADRGQAVEWV